MLAGVACLAFAAPAGGAVVETTDANTKLVVTSNGGAEDVITITASLAVGSVDYTVTNSAGVTESDPDCATGPGANQVTCGMASAVIEVNAVGGNDQVTVGTGPGINGTRATLNGGEGNDELTGGNADDSLDGGPGSDVLMGRLGADAFASAGDTVSYADRTLPGDAVTVTVDGVANDGTAGENDNVGAETRSIVGGAGADHLIGGPQQNLIDGGGGDDHIEGGGGPDAPVTHGGNPFGGGCVAIFTMPGGLLGGTGADHIEGGTGTDNLEGGLGSDVLEGDADSDRIVFVPSGISCTTTRGGLHGGEDPDTVDGGAGSDDQFGGAGADLLLSLDGAADSVDCGADTDSFLADVGDTVSECETSLDADADGVATVDDNCPAVANPDQANNDADADGDVCDGDDDNDNVADASDNCRLVVNPDQANNDADAEGDVCDQDDDNDNVADASDNCRLAANSDQANNDADADGDVCDGDDDNDNAPDASDNCRLAANEDQQNNDGDPYGDPCDDDDDNDAASDASDNCRLIANPDQANHDADADGDACDGDDDGDGTADGTDRCHVLAATTASGCPDAVRTLSLSYSKRAKEFRGAIDSSSLECERDAPVTVLRRKRGTDRELGTVSAASDGSFALKQRAKRGKYFASVAVAVVPGVAECSAAGSNAVRIR